MQELGFEVYLVSTHRPLKAIVAHAWAEEAEKNTIYLSALGIKDSVSAVTEIIKAKPAAWLQCLSMIIKA